MSLTLTPLDRRHFLLGSAATFAGAAGLLGTLNAEKAWAADTTGYKALVCIFLKGGMDHADTILPLDQASWDQLRSVRSGLFTAYGVGSGNSSRDRARLLELQPENASDFGSRVFGLPVQLSGLHRMFEAGEAAIIGNVGPLRQPTDRTQYERNLVPVPPRLFSHNDQQSTWMSGGVEGTATGWGGRFADAAINSNAAINPLYAAITTGANDVFLAGNRARAFFASSSSSAGSLNVESNRNILGNNSRFDGMRTAVRDAIRRNDYPEANAYRRDYNRIASGGIANTQAFASALRSVVPVQTAFPTTGLGNQLRTVADSMVASSGLGVSRQVYYVTTGGYDTHSAQASTLPNLHSQLDAALTAFRAAMIERGLWNNVTVFTASDFGRTTIDNGDGTDHGWGAHQFVAGGAVRGKRVYGEIPPADMSSPRYTASRGRLIPAVSVEQFAATLGSWFGLSQSELAAALPNLSRFPTANLGFMR